MTDALSSVMGRRLGIAHNNQLISKDIEITQAAADVAITVGDQSSNDRTITMQFKDTNGDDIDYTAQFDIYLYTSSARTAYATTGGTTGLVAGTDGALLAILAKKHFIATAEADGDFDATWTDTATGAETVSIGVKLPTGRIVNTAAFANT